MQRRGALGRRSRLLAGAGTAAALVLVAAACGGGGSGGETTATNGGSATVQWAGGVCTAFTTWKTSVKSIHLGAHPSSSDVENAKKQLTDATETLTRSLRRLGKPDTAAGQAAQQNLNALGTVITNDRQQIEDVLKTKPSTAAEALQQISTVSATLAAMVHSLNTAVGNLKKYDPSGELEKAFHQAPSCAPYFTSS